jgi:hypothetical protein
MQTTDTAGIAMQTPPLKMRDYDSRTELRCPMLSADGHGIRLSSFVRRLSADHLTERDGARNSGG